MRREGIVGRPGLGMQSRVFRTPEGERGPASVNAQGGSAVETFAETAPRVAGTTPHVPSYFNPIAAARGNTSTCGIATCAGAHATCATSAAMSAGSRFCSRSALPGSIARPAELMLCG